MVYLYVLETFKHNCENTVLKIITVHIYSTREFHLYEFDVFATVRGSTLLLARIGILRLLHYMYSYQVLPILAISDSPAFVCYIMSKSTAAEPEVPPLRHPPSARRPRWALPFVVFPVGQVGRCNRFFQEYWQYVLKQNVIRVPEGCPTCCKRCSWL